MVKVLSVCQGRKKTVGEEGCESLITQMAVIGGQSSASSSLHWHIRPILTWINPRISRTNSVLLMTSSPAAGAMPTLAICSDSRSRLVSRKDLAWPSAVGCPAPLVGAAGVAEEDCCFEGCAGAGDDAPAAAVAPLNSVCRAGTVVCGPLGAAGVAEPEGAAFGAADEGGGADVLEGLLGEESPSMAMSPAAGSVADLALGLAA